MPPLLRLSASPQHTLPLVLFSLPPVCLSLAFPTSLLCLSCLSNLSLPSSLSLYLPLSALSDHSFAFPTSLLCPFISLPCLCYTTLSMFFSLLPVSSCPLLSVSPLSSRPPYSFFSPSPLLPCLSTPLPGRWMCRCCQPLTPAKISGSTFM